ncbi:MAG: glutamine synthetase family protein [Prevotella sp.]|jgi:glutamine synthetase
MRNSIEYAANPIVRELQKDHTMFTKEDIMKYIVSHQIRFVNFMYPAGDGRLKTLNFVINDLDYLDTILTGGERVDGSSLFNFIASGSSDLYVIPRFSTAFLDPFSEQPTLCMLCSFFNREGKMLESSPENTLRKATEAFREVTGMEFHAMGELEFYVIRTNENRFNAVDQRGYHESGPFSKGGDFRKLCMDYLAQAGCRIKYGHSEVGNFIENGFNYEQNEIEFLPVPAREAADQLVIAKWCIRNLAYREGVNVTFAPKITTGKAGSGLHIHMRMMKKGVNQMLHNGELSETARTCIAGMMDVAESITAFGNKNPTSYFRLVPHQEAPTNVCWGISNRSALVRVPLGWTTKLDMSSQANPMEKKEMRDLSNKQTVEMRSPDGSADVYQLIAGLCVACRHGFEMENPLEMAKATFVDGDIHDEAHKQQLAKLKSLPDSCAASADCLERQRKVFEEHGVFSPSMIDSIIADLRSFNDRTLRADIANDPEAMEKLVKRFIHCG